MSRNRNVKTTTFIPTLIAALLVAPALAPTAVAQSSDAATATASVTVEDAGVTVQQTNDLLFGAHFASEGVVQNTQEARWLASNVLSLPIVVDLTVTQLPATLSDGAGNTVPVTYEVNSLQAHCDDPSGAIERAGDPAAGGIPDCTVGGTRQVWIGNGLMGVAEGAGFVFVDLTDAPAGTYTGTLELTATVQ